MFAGLNFKNKIIMEKSIYAVTGFVPNDEKRVVVNIYKLIKIGASNPVYGWISLSGSENHGIGTCTDDFGKQDKDEAILSINCYLEERKVILKCNFDTAIIEYERIKSQLEIEYKEYLNSKED